MNYVVIEDEIHNAELLSHYIQQLHPEAVLAQILPSIEESKKWFDKNSMPDLVFMDIRLEDGLSFELFHIITFTCPIIFTTAYDEYALQAFKVYGAAYLLKPIIKSELLVAIDKNYQKKDVLNVEQLKQMIATFSSTKKTYKKQFLIHHKDQFVTIPVEEIDYIYVDFKSTFLCKISGEHFVIPYTLEDLEQQLDPELFFRANRQYIITMESLRSIHKYATDKAKVILKRNTSAEVMVSRLRLSQFKIWLDR